MSESTPDLHLPAPENSEAIAAVQVLREAKAELGEVTTALAMDPFDAATHDAMRSWLAKHESPSQQARHTLDLFLARGQVQ